MHTNVWTDMFVLTLPVTEKILRSVIVYLFLVIGLRLAGKRELAQLNPFDLVVLLTLSNTVQNAIIGDDNSVTGGLLGAATLLAVNYLVVRFLFGHQKLDRIVEGQPDVLIDNGKIQTGRLGEELITLPELEAAARRQGFVSLEEVERAVLEPGGTLSFIGKKPAPEELRHRELLRRLDQVMEGLTHLRMLRNPPRV
ncbi:MAG TPA: YetF domain-containing protein [Candidatus Acidoferrales bacterium]|nr:YetF domain-containing protein [Candidatus Acidoferrales bacterium]